MRGGALVAIETSVNIAYAYDIRGEMIGETGVVTLAERNDVVVKANGMFSGRVPADWRERFTDAFDTEFRAWIAAAEAGGATGPLGVGRLCRDDHQRRRQGDRSRRPRDDRIARTPGALFASLTSLRSGAGDARSRIQVKDRERC